MTSGTGLTDKQMKIAEAIRSREYKLQVRPRTSLYSPRLCTGMVAVSLPSCTSVALNLECRTCPVFSAPIMCFSAHHQQRYCSDKRLHRELGVICCLYNLGSRTCDSTGSVSCSVFCTMQKTEEASRKIKVKESAGNDLTAGQAAALLSNEKASDKIQAELEDLEDTMQISLRDSEAGRCAPYIFSERPCCGIAQNRSRLLSYLYSKYTHHIMPIHRQRRWYTSAALAQFAQLRGLALTGCLSCE